jgi:hypothetical protein
MTNAVCVEPGFGGLGCSNIPTRVIFFEFVFGSYGRASEASLYANHILCLVGMLERLVPGALERKSLGHNY